MARMPPNDVTTVIESCANRPQCAVVHVSGLGGVNKEPRVEASALDPVADRSKESRVVLVTRPGGSASNKSVSQESDVQIEMPLMGSNTNGLVWLRRHAWITIPSISSTLGWSGMLIADRALS